MSGIDGQDSIDLPPPPNPRPGPGLQMLFALTEGQLVHVTLGKGMGPVKIQPPPVPSGIDVKVESGVFGLHAHRLAIRVRRCRPETVPAAFVQPRLATVIHAAVANITVCTRGWTNASRTVSR